MKNDASLSESLSRIFASEPDALRDPFPVWNRLREATAVFALGDTMLMARHSDVAKALRDKRFLSNPQGSGSQFEVVRARLNGKERVALDEVTEFEAKYVSRQNGETHARLRRIAQRAFAPQRIAALGERISLHVEDLLRGVDQADVFDLKPFAYRLPLRVIGELLEIPLDDLEKIHVWSNALGRNRGGTDTPILLEAYDALREFRAYSEAMIETARVRGRRGEDSGIVGLLMDAEQEDRLTPLELTAMFVVLLFAGHETTTNLIASGIQQLLLHNAWKELAADPAALPGAVEELLRFVTPVQYAGRVAGEDIEWDGVRIPRGTTVFLSLAGANRDPSVFANPDTLDVRRKDVRSHLSLGYGPHLCIGLHLARMEGSLALASLLRKFPDLELASNDYRWGGHAMLRGLLDLPVQCRKSPSSNFNQQTA